jgi:5-methylcytosine-specific restriction endonuclease McrA
MTVATTKRVLLVNGDFRTPMGTLPIHRAVNLILGDKVYKAEGVEPACHLKTPNTVFEVPSVLILKRYINVPHRKKKWSRRGVLERDNYTCIYCGVTARDDGMRVEDFTIDHIIPTAQGGKGTWVNTACACYNCNHTKANRTPSESGFSLKWEPKTPRTNYWVASGEYPASWKFWLEA